MDSPTPRLRHSERALMIPASPQTLYSLVADPTRWPAVFEPTVHVEHLHRDEREERFRIWSVVNGTVASWVSRRNLNPQRLHIAFTQEVSSPPVRSMAGEWRFRPLAGGGTEVVLRHRYTAVDDDPRAAAWIGEALDRNDRRELGALDRVAKLGSRMHSALFTFQDTIELPGAVEDVYAFVRDADLWPQRLPNVGRVRLENRAPNVQELEMQMMAADGQMQASRSIRICEPGKWIAYKQTLPPAPLLGHSGLWTFEPTQIGTLAAVKHTVLLDPAAVRDAFDGSPTYEQAREQIRQTLGRNALATLSFAGAYAESRSIPATP